MHDPKTVAHEIKSPFKIKGDKINLITIWHNDPEKDGTDDSCGWFMRAKHGNKKIFEEIKKEFEFNFKHNYWFDEDGFPKFSAIGTVLNMYRSAAYKIFKSNKNKMDKFMKKHLYDLIHFSENSFDSLRESVYMTYGKESTEYRINNFVSIIYADILRRNRPWYKHPRWHIHHWSIQIHPLQQLKRRFWDKCSVCGKRGFKETPMSDWYGTKLWHQKCDTTCKAIPTEKRLL